MEINIDKILDYYKVILADKIKRGKLTVEEVERSLKYTRHDNHA